MKNTFLPSINSLDEKTWYLIDAENKTLGRVATQIAQILIGKHKSDYSYHLDTGDYIVVINAEKIIVSGQKAKTKL
jgi:large subunit ribosomal protein L13